MALNNPVADFEYSLTEDSILDYLASPRFNQDPNVAYRFFLENPGWRSPSGYRVFSRFADVIDILRDPETFGQPGRDDANFHTVDPPDHTRLRKLVSRAFTSRAVVQQRAYIEEVADELLAGIASTGSMDLASDFSMLLPGRVTAKMLGIDYEDGQRWQSWLEAIKDSRGIVHYLAQDPEERRRVDAIASVEAAGTATYLAELIRQRRNHDGEDIISVLARAREGDDELSEREILYTLLLLLGAGLHTTSAQIATTMRLILDSPSFLEELLADPSLIENAVEEGLRFEGALQAEYRLVKTRTEVGGVSLEAGELVLIVNGAANRDPAVFENPDVFDIHRPNAKDHLSFGRGIHRCLGAELAREELVVGVGRLLTRLPGLHATVTPVRHRFNRWPGPVSLPVVWDPVEAANV
jgi:cytochrome P450